MITQKSQNAFNARPAKSDPLGNGARTGNLKQEVWTLLREVCMLHNGPFCTLAILATTFAAISNAILWRFRGEIALKIAAKVVAKIAS